MGGNRSLETYKLKKTPHNFVKLRETSARVGLERVRNGPSVGGSFAVASAPMVLERWSSERGGAREAFFGGVKGRALLCERSAKDSISASGAKHTRG